MSASSFKKLEPEEYLRQHYQQGLRPDGRKGLNSLRPVSISVGSITVADGSAVVKQGDTIVVRNFPGILVSFHHGFPHLIPLNSINRFV